MIKSHTCGILLWWTYLRTRIISNCYYSTSRFLCIHLLSLALLDLIVQSKENRSLYNRNDLHECSKTRQHISILHGHTSIRSHDSDVKKIVGK